MALTRKMLKAMGVEDEKIDQIIEAHTDTTDALKADRDKYKAEVESLTESVKELEAVTKERDELQKQVEDNESYKEKYDNEHKAFDDFKKEVEGEREKAKKTEAYKALLKKANVSEKRLDSIIRVTDIDAIELDENGEVKDSDNAVETIKTDWAEFIVTESTAGVKTETPPANNGGGAKTRDEIMAIKDRNERQKAISENHELFGY